MKNRFRDLSLFIRLFLVGGIILIIVLSAALVVWPILGTAQQNAYLASLTPTPTPVPEKVSPYIFGTNMRLLDNRDQVLTSEPAQSLLQEMHMHTIRIIVRANTPPALVTQVAVMLKRMHVVPVVSLQGIMDDAFIDRSRQVIQLFNQQFGSDPVYYEVGNEEDVQGVTADQYAQRWNQIVPKLREVGPLVQFVGPALSHYDEEYLKAFLTSASPRPDMISWHEYTCLPTEANELCLSRIDDWSKHFEAARKMMATTVWTNLPIMVSAWNYTPTPQPNDGKTSDPAFLGSWTEKALQILVKGQIFAAMQDSATNMSAPLIDQTNSITEQGKAFEKVFGQVVLNGDK